MEAAVPEGRMVVLAGGGTGGHVYPALSIGDAIVASGHRITYLGDPNRLEGRVVPARGIDFRPVPAFQYPRSGMLSKGSFAWSLFGAVWACRRILRDVGADAVLGVGGYISAAPVLAAWTLGLPTAIHEANVTPGLANRLCARVAKLVLLTYGETRLPGSASREVVGCPVSPAILQGNKAAALDRYGLRADRPVVLVVGGSLGASTLNRMALHAARHAERSFQIALITGPKQYDAVMAELGPPPEGVAVIGYEDRMADAYAAADLVVARSGSSTLAELCALGKPSVLVPSPNVTDNHQEGNARGLQAVGAAEVVLEAGLDLEASFALWDGLLRAPDKLAAMGERARSLARLDTAQIAAALVVGLISSPR